MKPGNIFILSIVLMMLFSSSRLPMADNPVTLAIGSQAPDFKLKATDGSWYTLASFNKAKLLVNIFTCNHCPTAQAYEDRIKSLVTDYSSKGVAIVAISPNDPLAVRLDELGYSDMGDSFEEMRQRVREKQYNFPYLYDGDSQTVAKAYGPVATPHVFIFDNERKLRFHGRIDDTENPAKTPKNQDTRKVLDDLLAGGQLTTTSTKVFGCSVKWAEKKDHQGEALAQWAKEPVQLEMIDESGIKELLVNNSGKLRLINVWATWCGPCVIEFPDLVNINRMYRGRDFEFISVSADAPEHKNKVLQFLKANQASNKNYLFSVDDKYKLIEAIDPKWQGALPYSILVEPGGKIVYAKQGGINVAGMKKQIVENEMIGRFYK